jgi:hypothetical protein
MAWHIVFSLADTWLCEGIELIPSTVFCQKIIDFRGEKTSIHQRMRKALRPPWLGILGEESANRGKRKLLGKGPAKTSIQSNLLP